MLPVHGRWQPEGQVRHQDQQQQQDQGATDIGQGGGGDRGQAGALRGRPEGGEKGTPVNIAATGAFVVNIATYDLREKLNVTGMADLLGAIFGEVVRVHIDDDLIVDGRVSMERLQPLARLGYQDYCTLGRIFEMPLPEFDRLLRPDLPAGPGED